MVLKKQSIGIIPSLLLPSTNITYPTKGSNTHNRLIPNLRKRACDQIQAMQRSVKQEQPIITGYKSISERNRLKVPIGARRTKIDDDRAPQTDSANSARLLHLEIGNDETIRQTKRRLRLRSNRATSSITSDGNSRTSGGLWRWRWCCGGWGWRWGGGGGFGGGGVNRLTRSVHSRNSGSPSSRICPRSMARFLQRTAMAMATAMAMDFARSNDSFRGSTLGLDPFGCLDMLPPVADRLILNPN